MKQVPEPYQHQIDANNFIANKNYFALFMEQGTGKSKVAIKKAYELYNKALIDGVIIISPNAVKTQWVEEQFPEHFPIENYASYIWEGAKTQKAREEFFKKLNEDGLFIFSINVEAFQFSNIDLYIKMVLKNRRPFIIIDESTKIKNGRRKPRRGKRGGAKRTNKILDLFKECTYKCILTGTPTPNNPFDLWSQFEFLRRDFFGMDYFYFTHHHGIMIQKSTTEGRKFTTVLDEKSFNIVKNQINKLEKLDARSVEELSLISGLKMKDIINISKMETYSGFKNLKELRDRISNCTFFIKKKDCLDLPDKVYETLYSTMNSEQSRVYKQLKKDMFADYNDREVTVTNKLVMSLRLQMVTGGLFPYAETTIKLTPGGEEYFDTQYSYEEIGSSCKIKTLIEDLEEVPKDTYIIVWARFIGEVQMINQALTNAGNTCEMYYGDANPSVIDRFKNGGFKILIATEKGAEGLNLQIATLHYFFSNTFRGDMRLQKEDRSHRIGQTNKVTYKDIICKGTIDERVYAVLKSKEDMINYFRSGGEVF